MKTEFVIKQIPNTIFGCDVTRVITEEIRKLNCDRPLLIIDHFMHELGLTNNISGVLAGEYPASSTYVIKDKILSDMEIRNALSNIAPDAFDIVIAFGGWRCTDLAKLISLHATNPEIAQNFLDPGHFSFQRGVPVISIPTTPPNGAEIDHKIIFRDIDRKILVNIENTFFAPRLTLIDPNLMLTLPPDMTASTGLDALCHAIEALVSIHMSPFAEIIAFQSIVLLKENLMDAFRNGSNYRARYNVALGSLLSALALNMTGSGIIHAMAYPLTARHAISHPQATAIVAIAAIRFNIPVVPAQLLRVARLLGSQVQNSESEAMRLIETLESLYRQLEQPMQLSSYNITGNDIEALTDLALKYDDCLSHNPRRVEREDLMNIYRQSL